MGKIFMQIFALLILMFGGNFGSFGYGNCPPVGDLVTKAEPQAGLNNKIGNVNQTLTIPNALGWFVA